MQSDQELATNLDDAQIDDLLLELNARVTGPEELRAWASETTVEIDRLTATPALTYVRLDQRDSEGTTIVLMLLEGVWERAL